MRKRLSLLFYLLSAVSLVTGTVLAYRTFTGSLELDWLQPRSFNIGFVADTYWQLLGIFLLIPLGVLGVVVTWWWSSTRE